MRHLVPRVPGFLPSSQIAPPRAWPLAPCAPGVVGPPAPRRRAAGPGLWWPTKSWIGMTTGSETGRGGGSTAALTLHRIRQTQQSPTAPPVPPPSRVRCGHIHPLGGPVRRHDPPCRGHRRRRPPPSPASSPPRLWQHGGVCRPFLSANGPRGRSSSRGHADGSAVGGGGRRAAWRRAVSPCRVWAGRGASCAAPRPLGGWPLAAAPPAPRAPAGTGRSRPPHCLPRRRPRRDTRRGRPQRRPRRGGGDCGRQPRGGARHDPGPVRPL